MTTAAKSHEANGARKRGRPRAAGTEILDRKPPSDEDSERGALASAILDPSLTPKLLERLRLDDFHAVPNRRLFAAMRAIQTADSTALLSYLREHGELEAIGGVAYLSELYSSHPTASHVDFYVKRVAEMGKRRRIRDLSIEALQGAYNGVDADQLVTGLQEQIGRIAGTGFEDDFHALDLETLLATDFGDGEMIIKNVLPAAQGGITSGQPKTGKTGIGGLDACLSVGSGRPFLGCFEVLEPSPAGIFTCESGWNTTKHRCRAIAAAKRIDPSELRGMFFVSTELPRLAILPDQKRLERFIKKNGLRLCVIDPTYLAFCDVGESASSVFKMGGALLPLTEIIDRTGCTIMLVNHNRKNRPDRARFDPPDISEISQSGFAEWLRFYVLLGHREEWDDEAGHLKLWMRTGGSIGFGGLHHLDVIEGKPTDPGGRRWDVTVEPAAKAARSEADAKAAKAAAQSLEAIKEAEGEIVKFLYRQPERRCVDSKIRDDVGRSKAVKAAMDRLEKQAIIRTTRWTAANNKPNTGWELVDREGLGNG